ncbi:MAG: hypothetical protein ACEQR8_11755 [Cypionkella sp.]
MRTVLTILAASAVISAAPPPTAEMPRVGEPPAPWLDHHDRAQAAACRARIEQVRAENGQPRLDRQVARPGEGYLMAAVDKRVDGCAVMQMLHDIDDIRPMPEVEPRRTLLMPAR